MNKRYAITDITDIGVLAACLWILQISYSRQSVA
jgi:hypothetical protein